MKKLPTDSGRSQNSMNRKRARLAVALGLSFVVVGAVVLAFFYNIEKSEVKISKSLTAKANDYAAQEFGPFPSRRDYVASFKVLNGTIKSCEPLTMLQYIDWQAGRYMPNLTETDQGIFQYKSSFGDGGASLTFTRYLFFFNQDSYDKVIQISVVAYWHEMDTTGMTIGATLMTAGFAGLCIALGLALGMQVSWKIGLALVLMFLTAIPTFVFLGSVLFLIAYFFKALPIYELQMVPEGYYLLPLSGLCTIIFFASLVMFINTIRSKKKMAS